MGYGDRKEMLGISYLRYCIGILGEIPNLNDLEWESIYDFCCRQAILGVGFCGIEKLPKEQKPPYELLLQWIAWILQIENQNRLLNGRCVKLKEMFAEAGFSTLILKGQGNALMYPNPLRRQSGDIDIWVRPANRDKKVGVKKTLEYLCSKCEMSKQVVGYHHVEFPYFDDAEVEVHWRPSWKSSPIHNLRMQRWFIEMADRQFSHVDKKTGLHVPTWDFNVVYQLQHMYLHILQEGIGLRQVIDYFYLLKSANDDEWSKMEDIRQTLKRLDLWHFAGAMMYVLKEVLGMEEKYLFVAVDEKRGTFLCEEILKSGNFGQYDERNKELSEKTGIRRSLARLKRQYRFLRDYPIEVLCAPFQVYHVIWRKLKLWKWE